ncbi:hypothetical protein M3Y99_01303300 [Aphelenchoides fujianensis]|nr:hypothetical protein M3Y99_01303300 [Aphelenchoides fujianensis]
MKQFRCAVCGIYAQKSSGRNTHEDGQHGFIRHEADEKIKGVVRIRKAQLTQLFNVGTALVDVQRTANPLPASQADEFVTDDDLRKVVHADPQGVYCPNPNKNDVDKPERRELDEEQQRNEAVRSETLVERVRMTEMDEPRPDLVSALTAHLDEEASQSANGQQEGAELLAFNEEPLPAHQRADALEQLPAEQARSEQHEHDFAGTQLRRHRMMTNKLEGLRDLMKIALSRDQPKSKRAQLQLISEGLARLPLGESAGLRDEVNAAIKDAEREERVRRLDEEMSRAAALEPSEARAQLAAVRAQLAHLSAEGAAGLLLRIKQAEHVLTVEQEVGTERTHLLKDVRAAESLLAAPDAPIAQLRCSADSLRTAAPRLETIRRAFEQLEDNNEQTASKARVADQLAALDEQFRNTQQAVRDRMTDARRQQHAQLTFAVHAAQVVLAAPDVRPEQYAQHAKLLERAVPCEEEAEGGEEDGALIDLRRLVEVAAETRRTLGERANAWRELCRCRDLINDRHNAVRQLHENVQRAPLRSAVQVETDRDTLQTALANRVKPLNAEMEAMATLVARLEPLRVATSELRSVEINHKSLCDDYEELLTTLQCELDEERQLRGTTGRLREEVARLETAIADMSAAEVRSLRADRLPALVAQLDAVAERDRAANWRHVERQWPMDAAPDALRQRLQRVGEAAAEREALAVDEDAWAERRRQLDAQLTATHTYQEPVVLEQQLARHAAMLAAVAEWLRTSRLPKRCALIAQLDEEMSRTADRRHELVRLAAQQQSANEWLQRRRALDDALREVESRVAELTASQHEDSARIDDAVADVERMGVLLAVQTAWLENAPLPAGQRDAALQQLQLEGARLEQHEQDLTSARLRRHQELADKLATMRLLLEIALSVDQPESRRTQLRFICEELVQLPTEEAAGLRAEVEAAIGDAERAERVRRLDEDMNRAAAFEFFHGHFEPTRSTWDFHVDATNDELDRIFRFRHVQRDRSEQIKVDSANAMPYDGSQCTICLEDTPTRPVACAECRKNVGCFECVNKWCRRPGVAAPVLQTCPLCRCNWGTRPVLLEMTISV